MKNYFKLVLITLGLFLTVYSCQKDDTPILEEDPNISSIKAFNIDSREIPTHILDFVKTKTNNTFRVNISKRSIVLSRSHVNELSRETPLGTVQTNKVVQVYNERNTKYTFKVSNPGNANSVINLVVVDMDGDIIEYFVQYVFDDFRTLPRLESGAIDMSKFTGSILFYSDVGNLIGLYEVINGINTNTSGTMTPCDDNGTDNSTDNDNDNDNTTSGGGGSETTDDDGIDNTSNGGGSGSSGGNNESFAQADCIEMVYGDCGCGDLGPDDGHEDTGNPCCNGSPLIAITDTCTGNSYAYRASARGNGEDPCAGDVGVLIEIEEEEDELAVMIAEIEDCLNDNGVGSPISFSNISLSSYNLTPAQIQNIHSYLLDDNGCSDEAKDFVDLALEAIDEGGEVDFEKQIIFDSSWDNKECQKNIAESTTNSFGDISNSIQFLFGNNPNISLTYKTENMPPVDGQIVLAHTTKDYDENENVKNINITFNNILLNESTDLGIFSVGIHENLHAILMLLLENEMIDVDNDNVNLSWLAEEYAEYKALRIIEENPEYDFSDLEFFQHEAISELVEDIAIEIKAYGLSKGYDIDDYTYEALAWVGLTDTVAFDTMETEFQELINQIIDNEATNFEILAEGEPCN